MSRETEVLMQKAAVMHAQYAPVVQQLVVGLNYFALNRAVERGENVCHECGADMVRIDGPGVFWCPETFREHIRLKQR